SNNQYLPSFPTRRSSDLKRLELGVGKRSSGRRQVVHLRDAEQDQEGEAVPERRRLPRGQLTLTAPIAAARVEPGCGPLGWHVYRSEEHTSELQSRENLVC